MAWRERMAPVGVAAGVFAGLVSGVAMVGQVAKLPGVLTLFFSGVAAGASLAGWRHRRGCARPAGEPPAAPAAPPSPPAAP